MCCWSAECYISVIWNGKIIILPILKANGKSACECVCVCSVYERERECSCIYVNSKKWDRVKKTPYIYIKTNEQEWVKRMGNCCDILQSI